jgi:GMP synthase-like glutamine amidotransferase
MQEILLDKELPLDKPEPLPFPFNQRTFCRYEPIEKRIEAARVLVIDDLLRDERDITDVARQDWGRDLKLHLNRERLVAGLALENILNNVSRLVKKPVTRVAHLSEIAAAASGFRPDAIVLSGTLQDFDYYNPELIESFSRFIRETRTPVLGICGGHELVGLSYGARVVTLSNMEQHEQRAGRSFEYQYHFIRITAPLDPIFCGFDDPDSGLWQDYTREAGILRVWQNHGLQLDRVPQGFELLATSYKCRNQMMVKRTEGQLIYTVQFHLEKSFQDLSRRQDAHRLNPNLSPEERKRMLRDDAESRTRWAHQNESRDGRIIFENFLREALSHVAASADSCPQDIDL